MRSGSVAAAQTLRALPLSLAAAPVSEESQAICTFDASKRCCPAKARCCSSDDCTCERQAPCIARNRCFYGSRLTCRECIENSEVYRHARMEHVAATPAAGQLASNKLLIRCYAPTAASCRARADARNRRDRSPLTLTAAAAMGAALLTCSNATCPGGYCITAAAECT
ncbi:hypothetical protein GH5_08070 [Leishmania sp. Ghana 2012 LV757]|uniref:hypothetical protein n=1 Tax=Leishmania sp. Ghana 2012 LV757 TaxID=2803181 RepID=UPI001B7B3683|nr:hypothetical protein GH5_08070 [Leishmania sp. Ghana 2012 LV757]